MEKNKRVIAVAGDHAAISLKAAVKKHLEENGFNILDLGAFTPESCDYPDYALKACRSVICGECEKAVLICGTGIGMSMAANKLKGIRCAVCSDTFSARMTRLHNDANVLAIGERVIGAGLALDIVDIFLETDFTGEEKHKRRIEKITALERGDIYDK